MARDPQTPARGQGLIRSMADVAMRLASDANKFVDEWFGPWSPPPPATSDNAEEGRQFDYPTGWNLRRPPRSEDGIADVQELRNLSNGAEIVRMAIETRKDTLSKAAWTIQARKEFGERDSDVRQRSMNDKRIPALIDFFRYPDKEHDFGTWIRMLAEDALVLDAPAVYCRKNKAGGVYALEVVDGGTITRYLDAVGRTPQPPLPAYGQWIKGQPYKNYTTQQLMYYPRNPRPNKVYGMSPVEQIILHMNIILNRNLSQLAQYTVSNIPLLFMKSPTDWKPKDIRDFQEWFDTVLSGNIEERSKAIWIPDGSDPLEPKKEALKDEADEWFGRLVCWCFGLAPNFLIKQMNRASAENYWDQADEEGLLPWLTYFKTFINFMIVRWFGITDLEFEWQWKREPKPLDKAQIHQIYLQNKVMTPDEVREEIGLDPLTQEQKDELNPPMPVPDPSSKAIDITPQQKKLPPPVQKVDRPKY